MNLTKLLFAIKVLSTIPLQAKIDWIKVLSCRASCMSECFNVLKSALNSCYPWSCRLRTTADAPQRTWSRIWARTQPRIFAYFGSSGTFYGSTIISFYGSPLWCYPLPVLRLYRQPTFPPDPSTSSRVVALICICLSWRTSKLLEALVTKAVLLRGSLHYAR